MSTTLIHIGVRATNIEKTIRFWKDGLGLNLVQVNGKSYDLTDGYHNFRVFEHNGPSRPDHVSGMLDYLHIGIRVPDLQTAAQRMIDMGYEIFSDSLSGKEPLSADNPEEGAFKVEDPDGITVDVTSSNEQWPGTDLPAKA